MHNIPTRHLFYRITLRKTGSETGQKILKMPISMLAKYGGRTLRVTGGIVVDCLDLTAITVPYAVELPHHGH